MGRIVKFWDTGEKGDKDTGYHAPDGKNYSSKKAYDQIKKEQEEWKYCVDEIMFLLGYEEGMKPNTYIFKLLSELKPFGYDVVYDTIMNCTKDITWALTKKNFDNDIGRVKYIFAIITNNIMPVYQQKQAKIEQEKKSKIINMSDYTEDTDIGGISGKGNDVSNFLGDDD